MSSQEDEEIRPANGHADERTPLLAHADPPQTADPPIKISPGQADESVPHEEDDIPLPVAQVFLLCYARLVEPVAFFSIFPFISQMIYETGEIKKSDVGFYSGLIECLFSMTQMLLMIFWGKAADRFGRKPVLVCSLLGVSISVAFFGFSRTLWQMIVLRCIAGTFAGTIITVRTMLAENCTPKTQARAFSYFAFGNNIGILLGPLIGGGLAKPAKTWPSIFGHVQLFMDFPYALPTIVVGAFGISASIVTMLFVKETFVGSKNEDEQRKPLSMWEIARADGVSAVLFIYCWTMLLALSYTAVVPVFWFTPVELGGYNFSPQLISYFLGGAGAIQAVWMLVIFPPMQRRFGTIGVLRFCAYMWPWFFVACPIGNIFLRHHMKAAFWTLAPLSQAIGSGVAMAFTAVQLALNAVSPGPREFSTLNALALALFSGVRAFAPILFSSIFATGVRIGWLGGQLIWVVLIGVTVVFVFALRWLPAKAR